MKAICKTRSVLLAVLVVAAASISAARSDERVAAKTVMSFSLQDYRGKEVSLDDFREKQLVVVAFLGTECPLAKLYGPRLAKLASDYAARGVAVLGINSNSQDSLTELAAYARQHDLHFPLLKDVGNKVADQFGAQRTPEVFILDKEWAVRYHGRIDDQYGVGYARKEPKRDDLRIAIDELLADKPISQPRTEIAGCFIGRQRETKDSGEVTYANQISRLINRRCVECHRPGEIAPFSLTSYEEAAGWAETIGEVVEQQRMPPWHASPGHADFAEDRLLSTQEREQIKQWVAAGAPRGDLAQLPTAPEFPTTGWQLPQKPDAIHFMSAEPYKVPAQGTVSYKFFRSDAAFDEDKWIKGVEVVPGNRAVVHHILVFAKSRLSLRDTDEGGERGFLAAYVPGLRAAMYPTGMAKKIPAGSKLVFQIHYTPNGSEQLDRSQIGLIFADPADVTHEIHTSSAVGLPLRIPPGADNHPIESKSAAAPFDVQLLAMMPHMHLRGKSFRYEAVFPDKSTKTLLDVPRYDFNWQTAYRLKEPLTMPKGAYLRCVAHFDNSEQNLNNPDPTRTVHWGPQTWDEMMIGYFDIAYPRRDGAKK